MEKGQYEDQIQQPLHLWTPNVTEISKLSPLKDLEPAYTELLIQIDTYQFRGKLSTDPKLWIDPIYRQ